MSRQLPPLTALRAFEAAARLGGVSKAADELHVTHAAISHQIRALEDWFGQPLFNRVGRQIRLTETGAQLLGPLTKALDSIADAVEQICEDAGQQVLTISAAPSVASRLIVSRLASFTEAQPDVEVHLHHSAAMANFITDGVDIALRYGRGDWSGTVSKKILEGFSQPVASPILLQREGIGLEDLPLSPARIAELQLHHEDTHENWRRWFETAGMPGVRLRRGTVYHDAASILSVAVAGQGVVLALPALAQAEISRGLLVPISDIRIDEGLGYYLVYPRAKASNPLVQSFEAWAMREIAQLPDAGPAD